MKVRTKEFMNRLFVLIALLGVMLRGFGQPVVSTPSFPSSVNLFDLFEVSFTLGNTYNNPYNSDTILIYGLFTDPNNNTFKIEAFYYEGYAFQKILINNDYYEKDSCCINNVGWKIRFTPTSVGNWKFRIFAEDIHGETIMPNHGIRSYQFTCNSVSNAQGFITKANSRYLKREVVKNGQRRFTSFYPVGPNVAWYSCYNGMDSLPKGIYDYEQHIDSLEGNANYMRIWLNRYQALSLYGPEFTQIENNEPKVYFDSIVNQKDSAELDHIIQYAQQHGIVVMPCLFSCGDFRLINNQDNQDPSVWKNNPFKTVLGLENACDFFIDPDAKKIAKQLIRYIISRWGYATNIMSWELWNEVDGVNIMCESYKHFEQDVQEWHEEMAAFIKLMDPYHRCVTTSLWNSDIHPYLYSAIYNDLDIVQQHNYQNIQKAASKYQFSHILYNLSNTAHTTYPNKLYFTGEFGFGQDPLSPTYEDKDPHGIDLHNSLWSSLFSTSIGTASFWWWSYLRNQGLSERFTPVLRFCENLPILSETFTPNQTGSINGLQLVFQNNIETYYMINETEDTIMGWCQDTAFAYQSLRWLTDSVRMKDDTINGGLAFHFVDDTVFDPNGYVYTLNPQKRPQPSSDSNNITIYISNQPIGTSYRIRWYNSETGLIYGSKLSAERFLSVQQDNNGRKYLSFDFPDFIRDLQHNVITNTFGDAVFIINKIYTPLDIYSEKKLSLQ